MFLLYSIYHQELAFTLIVPPIQIPFAFSLLPFTNPLSFSMHHVNLLYKRLLIPPAQLDHVPRVIKTFL